MNRNLRRLTHVFLSTTLALGLFFIIFQVIQAEEVIVELDSRTGRFDVVAAGRGTEDLVSGTVELSVPGNIVSAQLYWALRSDDAPTSGDNAVNLRVDTGPITTVVADSTRSYASLAFTTTTYTAFNRVYAKDITDLIQPGTHTYEISDMDPTGDARATRNYGFGIVVLYEDANAVTGTVHLREGLDYLYWKFPAERGNPSELNCIEFKPYTATRAIDLTIFVADVGMSERYRPNRLWYQHGTGITPTLIVSSTDATFFNDPFFDADGAEWDTYNVSLPVPENDTYACVQLESVDNGTNPGGASILWLFGGHVLRPIKQNAISLNAISASAGAPFLIWIPVALLVGFTLISFYRYRQRRTTR